MPTPDPHPLERHAPRIALGLVLVALVLRARGLGEYWLNADEGIYYSTLTHPSFAAFWNEVVANAHPPAFYLLLRGMGYVTWDFVVLRWAPLLFGVGAVWAFWRLGHELGGRGLRGAIAGLVAAAWLALSPEAVVLSQVLRPYTLVILLLGGGIALLLRWRIERERPLLYGYAGTLILAVLTHYSAALALGAISLLVAAMVLGVDRRPSDADPDAHRPLTPSERRDLLVAHAVPCVAFAALYLLHVSRALGSDLMAEALGPGGWLSDWLVASPESAWRGLVTLQNYHVPPGLRVRAAILVLAAITVSAASRDRTVALLTGGALLAGVSASVLGLYPFGPSRHNAWLVVFTIPALAWLFATIATAPRRQALAGAGALAVFAVAAIPLENLLGGPEARAPAVRTNVTEERVIRTADLAPLVVERLEPTGEPAVVLMTEQSYNMLMPLWATERDTTAAPDGASFTFRYGERDVLVVRSWDWASPAEIARFAGELPDRVPGLGELPDRVLVVAGGWGSTIMPDVPRLGEAGVAIEQTWAPGRDALGRVIPRMTAVVVDTRALLELYPGA